jgi:hypothetical protein
VLDFSALRTFQPLIATPCHGNSVFLNYVLSAIRLQEAYFFPPESGSISFSATAIVSSRGRATIASHISSPTCNSPICSGSIRTSAILRKRRFGFCSRITMSPPAPIRSSARTGQPTASRTGQLASASRSSMPATPSTPAGLAKT